MDSKIFLSIIIPAYNNPSELEGLCSSLHQQLNKETEVVVIDDGSKSSLKELVEKFNFKYFYKENSGPASSRNYGARLASGTYFLFLDSDTVMPEGMLEKILSIASLLIIVTTYPIYHMLTHGFVIYGVIIMAIITLTTHLLNE